MKNELICVECEMPVQADENSGTQDKPLCPDCYAEMMYEQEEE